MKGMRLFILFSLIFLLLSVSACSSDVDSSSVNPIVGDWEYNLSVSATWDDNAGELRDFFDFSDLSVAMELELDEDGTFDLYYDSTSLENYYSDMRSIYRDGLPGYIEYLIERDNGTMTVEEALDANYGVTIDEMADMMAQQARESMDIGPFNGSYWTSGNELHLLHNDKYDNVDEVFQFECDGDSLVLDANDIDDYNAQQYIEYILPMTFTRKAQTGNHNP